MVAPRLRDKLNSGVQHMLSDLNVAIPTHHLPTGHASSPNAHEQRGGEEGSVVRVAQHGRNARNERHILLARCCPFAARASTAALAAVSHC